MSNPVDSHLDDRMFEDDSHRGPIGEDMSDLYREAYGMKPANLEPCPLCGKLPDMNYIDDDGIVEIKCGPCSLALTDDRDSAIEKWNCRKVIAKKVDTSDHSSDFDKKPHKLKPYPTNLL